VSFLAGEWNDCNWYLPPRKPFEVICHGDFAPYNVVLQGNTASAIIDFDTAHPAPRVWDIAYALYRWAPLMRPDNPDSFGTLAQQSARARLFCDRYGLPMAQRTHLIDVVIERLQTLVDFMQTEAAAGNVAFQANLADGHHLGYLTDIAYLRNNQAQIEAILWEDVSESR
jgi:Ser/Thr protein kinase RdoA (MazF antagonist)